MSSHIAEMSVTRDKLALEVEYDQKKLQKKIERLNAYNIVIDELSDKKTISTNLHVGIREKNNPNKQVKRTIYHDEYVKLIIPFLVKHKTARNAELSQYLTEECGHAVTDDMVYVAMMKMVKDPNIPIEKLGRGVYTIYRGNEGSVDEERG